MTTRFTRPSSNIKRATQTLNNAKIVTENNALHQTILSVIDSSSKTENLLATARQDSVLISLTKDIDGVLPPSNGGSESSYYYPVFAAGGNVAAVAVIRATVQRIGNLVYVSGQVFITPTAGLTLTIADCTIPLNSKFITSADLNGQLAIESTSAMTTGLVTGNVSNCQANFRFYSLDTDPHDVRYTFSYLLL